LEACDLKNGKLATVALSTFQKFAANDGLSVESRLLVIKAMTVVRNDG
jgi:hypothetical protein